MAKWYDRNGNLMEDDTLEIGVAKPPRIMEGPTPGMAIAGARVQPIVEGVTIDRSLMGPGSLNPMGQFRTYAEFAPRRVGVAPGGERTVVTDQGDRRLMGADRRLMEGGYGGVMVRDGVMTGTDAEGNRGAVVMQPEGFAPIRTNDQRLAMSPEALSIMGDRQIMEEQTAQRGPFSTRAMGNRMSVRKELQAKADQGFVAPGTDARNREIMRGTEARQAGIMLERSRPRDLMARRNTENQIMAQADASLMTPQVQVQDGVMAGWDPIRKEIVSDSSGAKAIAAAKTKDNTLQGMSDDDLNSRLVALKARQLGEMDDMDKLRYEGLVNAGRKAEAEAFKNQVKQTKWSPEMQPFLDEYQNEWNRRKGVSGQAKPAGGGRKIGGISAR